MAKIAFVCLTFHWPPLGGAWVDEKEVLTRLAETHDVTLIVPDYQRFFPRGRILKKLPFKIIRIPFNSLTFNFFSLSNRIKKAVSRINPDYVILGECGVARPYIANALKDLNVILRFYSTSIWCFNQNYFPDSKPCNNTLLESFLKCVKCAFTYNSKDRMQEFLGSLGFLPSYMMALKKSYINAKMIIVYNEDIKKSLDGFNNHVVVIPGGVDCERFKLKIKKNNDEKIKIIVSGRGDDPAKGLSVLLKACEELGELKRRIEINITWCHANPPKFPEYVKVNKWLDFEALPMFYRNGAICVVPSLWQEPFGITAVEGMASGLPVIASDIGGLGKIVNHGENGYLFQPGNHRELAERMKILINDGNLREKMGLKGREKAKREYSWDVIMEKYYFPIFR